ncbi:MAG TPA: DUF4134 family protein [Pseudosphingobacterium sp.]|nr:DUF4134 family protein [Pseudosphingobacterium sp.]
MEVKYVVAGLFATIGIIRVYHKWHQNDKNTGKTAAVWFGASILLVVAGLLAELLFDA